ncbi:MAG: GGDEF domain-containing protein [Sandaracinaceae bacterium]
MQHLNPETLTALTDLAAATNPLEVERRRRAIERRAGEMSSELTKLVDAVAERALRCCDLERLATEDPLTGLANRRSFHIALDRELARRSRGRGPSVILLDLDCLKEINDRFGHAAGDTAIRHAAKSCVNSVRGGDLVARLGGDEFAVLLPDTDFQGANVVADRIRDAIEACSVNGVPLKVSLGVAIAGPDGDDGAAILAEADERMYADKTVRRGSLRVAA